MIDYYKLYNLSYDSTEEDIKHKYRQLALQHHPDRNPNNIQESTNKFAEIAKDFEELLKPEYRAKFVNKKSNVKKSSIPQYSDMVIMDAPPPTHDIWGKRLSPKEREVMDKLNKIERWKADQFIEEMKRMQQGFVDTQVYETKYKNPDIR